MLRQLLIVLTQTIVLGTGSSRQGMAQSFGFSPIRVYHSAYSKPMQLFSLVTILPRIAALCNSSKGSAHTSDTDIGKGDRNRLGWESSSRLWATLGPLRVLTNCEFLMSSWRRLLMASRATSLARSQRGKLMRRVEMSGGDSS